ncbi:MAG: alpha/beta hydrolase, partial [Clostridia bacterium]|nr:alpha/beta hydrolase [Clostridia bacterium]
RAHGKSEGKYICYGVLERYDALGWCEKIIAEKGRDEIIFISGVSMGASTSLMASGLSLPENVRGIIADCGFTSPSEIIKKVMREDMGFPLFPIFYTTRLLVKLVAKFDLNYSSLDALKTNTLPVLFIHGTADNFVPFYMSEQNFEGCKTEKYSVWVEGAGHGTSFLFETERCVKALEEFTNKYI